jgi:hypothetical protein
MLMKKIEMINYINRRDKKIKFRNSGEKFTSQLAGKKAAQLLWKIRANRLPILQNASYCYSFVWHCRESGAKGTHEKKRYYVVDIYDNMTYARTLNNPAEIYYPPQIKDRVSYTKLYNNINRIVKDFLTRKTPGLTEQGE